MKVKTIEISRRSFISQTSIIAEGLTFSPATYGAAPLNFPTGSKNDKIKVGFIGLGNRGKQLLQRFMQNEEVLVTALSDVYKPYVLRDYNKVHPRWKEIGIVPFGKRTSINSLRTSGQHFGTYRKTTRMEC